MNPFNSGRPEISSIPLSGSALLVAAGLCLLLWAVLHVHRERVESRWLGLALLPLGAILAVAASWLGLQGMARIVEVETTWRLDHLALVAGIVLEAIGWLLGAGAGRAGRVLGPLLLGLRACALALVIAVLCEPVRLTETIRRWQKQVAVVLDISESMGVVDRRADPDWAERLGGIGMERSRISIAEEILKEPLAAIAERYGVRVFHAGEEFLEVSPDGGKAVPTGRETDYAKALDGVLRTIPEEELAGCLFLGDGRDSVGGPASAVARGFRAREAPIAAVAIGSSLSSMDLAVIDAMGPPRVWEGDEATIEVDVRLTGIAGETATVILRDGEGEVAGSEEVEATGEEFRKTVRFVLPDLPQGTHEFIASIPLLEGEQLEENNEAIAAVSVVEREENDDRVDVLLADALPRWEFRYLRNLFDGRDETVDLTYVLAHPERIAGVEVADPPRLPSSFVGWKQFDVLLLGDLDSQDLGPTDWENVEKVVAEEGTLLVLIAGRRAMPHRITADAFLRLLPVRGTGDTAVSDEEEFRIAWTPEGELHDVMLLDESLEASRLLWNRLPPMRWRRAVGTPKEGAEILAFAQPVGTEALPSDEMARQNALIVTQRYGRGRVVLLCSDRSWRLRYGIGDRFHHRFWWRLIHWQDDEVFGDGKLLFALRAERPRYDEGEDVLFKARALDGEGLPLDGTRLSVRLRKIGNPGPASEITRELGSRDDSPGIYEVTVGGLAPGDYEIALEGEEVTDWLSKSGEEPVRTRIVIEEAPSREFADLRRDETLLSAIARESGGRLLEPAQLMEALELFGDPEGVEITLTRQPLWDRWWVAVLFAGLLLAEWMLRRWRGLA